jgi:lipid-A-disaccharide synthase-like uncharacterized protein
MLSEWRIYLYYPLGLLPPILFGLRFLIQWIKSEKAGFSLVDAPFWRLSFAGNLLSFIHYSLQGQYPFALIQTGNGLIAWRNLNLMNSRAPCSRSKTIVLFSLVLSLAAAVCVNMEWASENPQWIRIPHALILPPATSTSLFWHLIGILGQGLFASRFWLQWWRAEREQRSSLDRAFWTLSLAGCLLSSLYFVQIRDLIGCLNQLFGIIPYVRNLMLPAKAH